VVDGTPEQAGAEDSGDEDGVEDMDMEEEEEEEEGYVPVVDEAYDPYVFIRRVAPLARQSPTACVLGPKCAGTPRVTLVLDLDETLVHASTEPVANPDILFPVTWNNIDYRVYAMKRPYLEEFLDAAAQLFEVVVFTASQRVYANKLLDVIDPTYRWFRHRLFRDSCVYVEGNYLKDLSVLGRDLRHTVIIDNSPQAFGFQYNNGVPILSWFDNPDDTELLKIIPFLRRLAAAPDVRPLLRARYKLYKRVESPQSC
jgi:CTD small phosphatase-like protein 2